MIKVSKEKKEVFIMNITLKSLLLTLILFMSHALISNSQSELAFIAKYKVDPEVEHILDSHHKELAYALKKAAKMGRSTHMTWNFPWLSDYMVKLNIDRIYGMEKMQRCIDKHNLDLFVMPDKRIYHIKDRPHALNSKNYLVVVKKIKTDPDRQPMTLRHIKQLMTLMKETGYISVTAENYIRTYEGKIAMIDTESNFDIKQLLSGGYIRLITSGHDISKDYTEEALQYILSQMALELAHVRGAKYKSIMSEIHSYLRKAKRTHWDYVSFFESERAKVSTAKVSTLHKAAAAVVYKVGRGLKRSKGK